MKRVRSIIRRPVGSVLIALFVSVSCLAFAEGDNNGVPNIFNPAESPFQNQTHFLVFTGSDTPGESTVTATAYYNAVNPSHNKRTFPQWLVNAGFISDVSQWHPTGPQLIACDLGPGAGCDMPAHDSGGNLVYGDNIINTDSHAIVLNAADLGFVRNQFIRCKPGCSSSNPIIYTYLENYPVNPFAASGNGGSGFPIKTGYPTTGEAQAAMESALNRPAVHNLAGCDPTKTDTAFKCKISRIADVAFEWAPPPTNPYSSTRYGQQYAYVFDDSNLTAPTETIAATTPADQNCSDAGSACTPNVTTRALQPFNTINSPGAGVFSISVTSGGFGYTSAPTVTVSGGAGTGATAVAAISGASVSRVTVTNSGAGYTSAPSVSFSGGGGSGAAATVNFGGGNPYTGNNGDPFPPNLDFIGFKQHPGVCYICHGGKPQKLTSSGLYPNQGNVSGFRFLPLDTRNLLFTSDSGLTSSSGDQPASNGSLAYTDRLHQELQIKEYNIEVLKTVPTSTENDGTGATRVAHVREVILGWYAGYAGDQTMSSNIQNGFWQATKRRDFIPQGWLEPSDGGTAPAGSEQLYLTVLSPSCRSCHFNREVSLDFGTYQNFTQESDILQLALLPYCKASNPDKGAKAMPLAHLTYQRYWEANPSTGGAAKLLPYPAPGLTISNTADQIANYFGYGNVQGYCATNP
jgi:hypothetical protein